MQSAITSMTIAMVKTRSRVEYSTFAFNSWVDRVECAAFKWVILAKRFSWKSCDMVESLRSISLMMACLSKDICSRRLETSKVSHLVSCTQGTKVVMMLTGTVMEC